MPTTRRFVRNDGPDYYPTPPWATKALLHYEKFTGPIAEPFCGAGAMVKVMQKAGCIVQSSDVFDYGIEARICDFRKLKGPFNNVVSNPPFNLAQEAIEFLLPKTRYKLCFLLRLAFLESRERYDKLWRHAWLSRVRVFSERLSLYPAGDQAGKASGTIAYAWFIFERQQPRVAPVIRFIPPGWKEK